MLVSCFAAPWVKGLALGERSATAASTPKSGNILKQWGIPRRTMVMLRCFLLATGIETSGWRIWASRMSN